MAEILSLRKFAKSGRVLAALLSVLATSSCVSVSLPGQTQGSHAEVRLTPPPLPFVSSRSTGADNAWRNPRNGNSISYFSNCSDANDPTLEALRREMLAGIAQVKILKSESLTFNGREAQRSLVSGLVDGVRAQMDIIVFKKNVCLYGISYVGVTESFDADHGVFDRFLKGFEAP